jgi:hypothetical protein
LLRAFSGERTPRCWFLESACRIVCIKRMAGVDVDVFDVNFRAWNLKPSRRTNLLASHWWLALPLILSRFGNTTLLHTGPADLIIGHIAILLIAWPPSIYSTIFNYIQPIF